MGCKIKGDSAWNDKEKTEFDQNLLAVAKSTLHQDRRIELRRELLDVLNRRLEEYAYHYNAEDLDWHVLHELKQVLDAFDNRELRRRIWRVLYSSQRRFCCSESDAELCH